MNKETELLHEFKRRFNPKNLKGFIGDDAAVIESSSKSSLISIDTLVENQHFKIEDSPELIGQKLVNVSVSDMAAMGGSPKYLLLSITLKKETSLDWVHALYESIQRTMSQFNMILLGGDTVKGESIVLSSVVLGEAFENPVYRDGARQGDKIYCTGCFGFSFLSQYHYVFRPRVEEIKWLIARVQIHSLIDASDGLYASLRLLLSDNSKGADINLDQIKIRAGYEHEKNKYEHALFDGEDFELVFTCEEMSIDLIREFEKKFQIPIKEIGEVVETCSINFYDHGERKTMNQKEFDHFS